jgi:hypothetical protein
MCLFTDLKSLSGCFHLHSRGNAPKLQVQTYTVLHAFTGGSDGSLPIGGLVLDERGNRYGTTFQGGTFSQLCTYGCGVVYQIDPPKRKLFFIDFLGGADGAYPGAGLIRDSQGNLMAPQAMEVRPMVCRIRGDLSFRPHGP